MSDRSLRSLERRARMTGDQGDLDAYAWAMIRAGQMSNPRMASVALERGEAPLECWASVGRCGSMELLLEVPFVDAEPMNNRGNPGAAYTFSLPSPPASGVTAATFYWHGAVLSRKDIDLSDVPLASMDALTLTYKIGDMT